MSSPASRAAHDGVVIRPFRCPRCARTVLWLDGESSPGLVYELGGLPVSCEGCHGKPWPPSKPRPGFQIHPAAAKRFRGVRPAAPADARPVAQIMRDDVRAVVGLALDVGNELAEAVTAVRKLLRKLKG